MDNEKLNNGLESHIFITVSERSVACGWQNTIKLLPVVAGQKGKSSALQAVGSVMYCRRQRYARLRLWKSKHFRAKCNFFTAYFQKQHYLFSISCLWFFIKVYIKNYYSIYFI